MLKPKVLEENSEYLEPGTKLLNGHYTIDMFLNVGGFGIAYLGKDNLDRKIVIKECYPGALCQRDSSTVGVRSRGHKTQFEKSVELFLREAKNLSKLKHPNIVGVHDVFQENQTAYMILDYIEGRELLDFITDKSRQNAPNFIIPVVEKILDALKYMHENNILHRDISPDNILIDATGEPILIDFGAARQEAAMTSRVLSTLRIVKDGYSPQEFYLTGSKQNESSDLYAFGATIYHYISGKLPPNSQWRLAAKAEGDDDPYEPLAGCYPAYSDRFLKAIDKSLNLIPKDRFQSAQEWKEAFASETVVSANNVAVLKSPILKAPSKVARTGGLFNKKTIGMMAAGACVAILCLFLAVKVTTVIWDKTRVAFKAFGSTETVSESIKQEETTPKLTSKTTQVSAPELLIARNDASKVTSNEVLKKQIAFTHWDLGMPYKSKMRSVDGVNLELILRVNSDTNATILGTWIKQGVAIYAVNGKPLTKGETVAAVMLKDLHVDQDGYTRASVRYKNAGDKRYETGLLSAKTIKYFGLENGFQFETRIHSGMWRTTVTSAPPGTTSGLMKGDILIQEVNTGKKLNRLGALEDIIKNLINSNVSEVKLKVRRNRQPVSVGMMLLTDEFSGN